MPQPPRHGPRSMGHSSDGPPRALRSCTLGPMRSLLASASVCASFAPAWSSWLYQYTASSSVTNVEVYGACDMATSVLIPIYPPSVVVTQHQGHADCSAVCMSASPSAGRRRARIHSGCVGASGTPRSESAPRRHDVGADGETANLEDPEYPGP